MASFKLFKLNQDIILNVLFCFIPLSFIIGNFAINLNIFLLLVCSLFFYKKKIFQIEILLIDKLILIFFIFIFFTGAINTIEYLYILDTHNTVTLTSSQAAPHSHHIHSVSDIPAQHIHSETETRPPTTLYLLHILSR